MSEYLLNRPGPDASAEVINAFFDGAAAAIRLYAVWREGNQWVGMGRPLADCLQDNENERQKTLDARISLNRWTFDNNNSNNIRPDSVSE